MPIANISVLVGRDFACVKIAGRANFAGSPDFKTLMNGLIEKGFKRFVIDLSECVLMDSTFLGVLAGLGIKLNPTGTADHPGIELHNTSTRVHELLDNLGTLHLFKLTSGTLELPAEVKTCQPESINPNHEQITRTSLEAHQTLMAMSEENAVRFKDVAQFLAEDLKNINKPS